MEINAHELELVQATIKSAEEGIRKHGSVVRLVKSRDFKAVVEKAYFDDYAASLVAQLEYADTEKEERDIITAMKGISAFRGFLQALVAQGTQAEKVLADNRLLERELQAGGE